MSGRELGSQLTDEVIEAQRGDGLAQNSTHSSGLSSCWFVSTTSGLFPSAPSGEAYRGRWS